MKESILSRKVNVIDIIIAIAVIHIIIFWLN